MFLATLFDRVALPYQNLLLLYILICHLSLRVAVAFFLWIKHGEKWAAFAYGGRIIYEYYNLGNASLDL